MNFRIIASLTAAKLMARVVAAVGLAMLAVAASGYPLAPPWPPPWAAVAFIAAGGALWAGEPKSSQHSWLVRVAATVVLLIGAVCWIEYVLQLDFGFDRVLFGQTLFLQVPHPGRPSVLASFSLTLLGLALLLFPDNRKAAVLVREFIGVAVVALCFLGAENYIVRPSPNSTNAMSVVFSALCGLCALSLLNLGPGGRLTTLLHDPGPAGMFVRLYLPIPLVFITATDLLRVLLRWTGLSASSQIILSSFDVLAAAAIVWASSSQVLRIDRKRGEAEDDLRQSRDELELRVQSRTRELVGANQHLAIEISNRERAQQETEKINTMLASVIEASPLAICAFNLDGTVRKSNAAASALLSSAHIDIRGPLERAGRGEHIVALEITYGAPPREQYFNVWASPITAPCGGIEGVVMMVADVSDRKALELQVRHTQKLESLGVLAGGVAHDFNNLLTGILGNASLAQGLLSPSHPARFLLEQTCAAAERAAGLTRQLLAYAGKGRFLLENVRLSSLVREITSLIRTSIPKYVELRLELAPATPAFKADASQMQQVVMNLVINAAEAIRDSGTVTVRTASEQVDSQYLRNAALPGDLSPGRYVTLEVCDNGIGMDAETRERIFDPFFTTKFTGRGLGLAAVQGIVHSHKGVMTVFSSPGRGTSFKLLFPVSAAALEEAMDIASNAPEPQGKGTILVIDDEDMIRQMGSRTLIANGYAVEMAATGEEGLEIFERHRSRIAGVLLDLTMPGIGGEETLQRLKLLEPGLPVILSSGYSESSLAEIFAGKGLAGFLQKPYTAAQLLSAMAAIRGTSAAAG
jgi:signal transduction histidine kinase/ActR/RegA family two-component response regulator